MNFKYVILIALALSLLVDVSVFAQNEKTGAKSPDVAKAPAKLDVKKAVAKKAVAKKAKKAKTNVKKVKTNVKKVKKVVAKKAATKKQVKAKKSK